MIDGGSLGVFVLTRLGEEEGKLWALSRARCPSLSLAPNAVVVTSLLLMMSRRASALFVHGDEHFLFFLPRSVSVSPFFFSFFFFLYFACVYVCL